MTMRRCWARVIPALWFSALFAAPSPPSAPAGLRLLAEGSEALETGRLPQAVRALSQARSGAPAVADYASFLLAQAEYRSHHYSESAAAAEQVVAFLPLSPLAGRAAILGARAYIENSEPRKALALLARIGDDALPAPEGRLVRASALEAAGSAQPAALEFQAVYYQYPHSPEAHAASDGLDRMRAALGSRFPAPGAALRIERADKLREAGDVPAARREYDQIAAETAGNDRDRVLVRRALAPYYAGSADSALSSLRSLGQLIGEAEAERLYSISLCQRRLERDSDLMATLDQLTASRPVSPWRLKAILSGSNRYLILNDPRQETVFTACAEAFPDSPDAPMCHWRAVWWSYRHRSAATAEVLRQHLMLYPSSEKAGAALFYLGRLAAKSGDRSAALSWYRLLSQRFPNYYYTFVARPALQRLESQGTAPARTVEDFLRSVRFAERPAKADLTSDAATAKRIERARLLDRVELKSWAEGELRFAARNGARPWPVALELAEMATRDGAPDRALRHIKGVLPTFLFTPRDGAPLRFWQLAFPLPYRALIEKYSRQNGLDPYLVAALIRQESEFNPKAVSPAKAIGLMQILPAVGRELARKSKLKGFRAGQLTQAETNIRLGTLYLRRLLDSCDGHIEETLAAYNAGYSRVVTWRAWGPYEEPNEFAETIPFTQTRDYIQIILRNAELYRWLYTEQPAAASKAQPARAAALPKTRK